VGTDQLGATVTTDTAGSLTENLIDCIEALGSPRPASKGLSELYQALATALQSFSGGYPLSPPQSGTLGVGGVLLVANTLTTIFTTPTLATGLWLMTYNLLVDPTSNTSIPTSSAAEGTATATFTGKSNSAVGNATSLTPGGIYELNCNFFANITSPGTILLQAKSNQADTILGEVGSLPAVGGWTASRIQ
jgi:hypothetical protein